MTNYILGSGCFWCGDAIYRQLRGVISVECGYAGGHTTSPTYEQVCEGTTGHAEVTRVTFDDTVIPRQVILDAFFLSHDPTSLNRQGADIGTQYRSIMLFQDSSQKREFEDALKRSQKNWDAPIVTEIAALETFYLAEPYHQDYYSQQPQAGYCQVVIAPKLSHARAVLSKWLVNSSHNNAVE